MSLADAILSELDDAALDRLAQLLAPRLSIGDATTPWLTVDEAAERIRGTRQRVYDLVHQGRLQPARDGRRVLFHRDDIDRYLASGRER